MKESSRDAFRRLRLSVALALISWLLVPELIAVSLREAAAGEPREAVRVPTNVRLFLSALTLAAPATTSLASRPLLSPGAQSDAEEDVSARRGVEWLKQQLSAPLSSQDGQRARLIDSYEDAARAGWVYDAAVAAIAFTAYGELTLAGELLRGLEHLQNQDGSWTFSYDPDAFISRGQDRFVGSIAWVVMAANFYEWETSDGRFAPMARRGLAYLERFRVTDRGSELFGAFSMGPDKADVVSTENNADCYAAFLWRGRIENNRRDELIAEDVRRFVFRGLGADRSDAADQRFFTVGSGARTLYLDAQTWTTLAFAGRASDVLLSDTLAAAEKALTVSKGRLGEIGDIVGLDDSWHSSDHEKVWAEGTEGMVAALLSVGQVERARRYHKETMRYQSRSGGIPYATQNDSGWSTAPSVAATSWFVLNTLSPPRNPFNPDVGSSRAAHLFKKHSYGRFRVRQ